MEEWRDIIGYEGLYQISNKGRVKSKARTIPYKDGRNRPVKTKYLKISLRDLYYCVDLSNANVRAQIKLHRLLGKAFIPNPLNKPEINHKDGNKLNNDLSNLEWCTHAENMAHAINNGLCKSGEDCTYSKLTKNQVIEIRKKYVPYKYPCSKLASEYGVNEGTIYYVVKFLNWKNI